MSNFSFLIISKQVLKDWLKLERTIYIQILHAIAYSEKNVQDNIRFCKI